MRITRYLLAAHEGERVKPPWLGISYYDFDSDVEFLHLVPFNFFIAWVRNGYTYLRYRYYPLNWEKREKEAFEKGVKAGVRRYFIYHSGYKPDDN